MGRRHNRVAIAARLPLAAIAAIVLACSPGASDHEDRNPSPIASLIAVGDTGSPWGMAPQLFEGQLAVGQAMQREHARLPIDAFVLLGDNFYPSGLLASELSSRIVENVGRPYCAFVDPSPELAAELSSDCVDVESPRPRVFAVTGNHDLESSVSHTLQKNEVPKWVRNWDMPVDETPAIRELAGGLSLIFLDSDYPWGKPETSQLAEALRRAKGPWRVIVGHRPPIAGHPQLSRMVSRAAAQSGKTVHVYLAAHVHVLAALRGKGPEPALTIIAGSGSEANRQDTPEYRIEEADFVVEELGFVRLDVLSDPASSDPASPDGARLQISLFTTSPSPALGFLGHPRIARYTVNPSGSVERIE